MNHIKLIGIFQYDKADEPFALNVNHHSKIFISQNEISVERTLFNDIMDAAAHDRVKIQVQTIDKRIQPCLYGIDIVYSYYWQYLRLWTNFTSKTESKTILAKLLRFIIGLPGYYRGV